MLIAWLVWVELSSQLLMRSSDPSCRTRKMDHLRGGAVRGARAGDGRCSRGRPRSSDGGPRPRDDASSSPRYGSHRSHTHDRDHSRSRSRTAAHTPDSSSHAQPPLPSMNRPSSSPPAGELWTSRQRCVTLPISRVGCAPSLVLVPTNKKLRRPPELFLFSAIRSIPPTRRATARMMLLPGVGPLFYGFR